MYSYNKLCLSILNKNSCILYYADWCPHCKSIYSYDDTQNLLWNQLEKELKDKTINGVNCECYAVNCADDSNKSTCKSNNIKGYPTIKINGNVYDGKRDFNSIMTYLKSVIS